MYQAKNTQESRILDLLIERGEAGAYSYELAEPQPKGLGCLQYNARLYGLRKKGHNIISDRDGHFILHRQKTMEEMRLEVEKAKINQNLEKFS
jgi:hypothetical protein